MSIIFKHIWRNIRENKFRSILIVFSLAVSTMVLFLNLTIKDDLANKYKSVLQGAYQDYDIEITKNSNEVSEQYFDSSALNLGGINADNYIDMTYSSGIYSNKGENIDVTFVGCDRESMIKNNLCTIVKKSDLYDANSDNQIIISEKNADKYNVKLGDTVTISTQKGEQQYIVAALAKTSGFFLMENDSFYIITDMKCIQELTDSQGKTQSVLIDLKNGENAKKISKLISDNNKDYLAYTLVDEDAVDEALSIINQLLMIVMVAVVILNFYVIRNIIKLIMATRMPVVGTFRSIGATKGKMNAILILENAAYGIIGSLFGIIFGILLREPVSSIFINAGDAFDYVDVHFHYKPSYIIISVAFSILLQIVIALSSIIKAGRKSIKNTIFNTLSTSAGIKKRKIITGIILIAVSVILYYANTKYNILMSVMGIVFAIAGTVMIIPALVLVLSKVLTAINRKLFGPAAEIGTKTLHKSKTTRSSIVLVTVAIAIMMVIYMTVLTISNIFTKAEDTCQGDILASGLEDEESEYDFIREMDGFKSIYFEYYQFDTYKLNGTKMNFGVYGADGKAAGIDIDEKLAKNLKDDEIVVDKFYAESNDIKVGDKLTIDGEYMTVHNRTYIVKGFMNSTDFTTQRNMMYVNRNEYTNTYTKVPSTFFMYTTKKPKEMKEDLRKALAGTNTYIQTKTEFIDNQRNQTNSILGMVEAMLGLSVILSLFGLMNNQIIGFIQKKKEYAVLYSTSMSKSQLRVMVLFEVLGTFICGCLIGMELSIWLTGLLEQVLSSIGLCLNIAIQFKQLAVAVIGIFAVLSLTAIGPMRKVSKIKVVDEIKYE